MSASFFSSAFTSAPRFAIAALLTIVSGCKESPAPPAGGSAATSDSAKASAPAEPAAPKAAAYVRSARTCAEISAGLASGLSKSGVTPGSWGKVPPEFQVLPPGAELCGAGMTVKSAVIRSPLFGDDLGAFYKPLATRSGCTWEGVKINESGTMKTTHVTFTCPSKKGGSSLVHTDSGSEFYYVSY
jgi:hypothetical protein